jgi:hypothetical protein
MGEASVDALGSFMVPTEGKRGARMTYTYAILDVSPAAYAEIRAKLAAVGYGHSFHKDGKDEVIDMRGIALRQQPEPGVAQSPLLGA